MTADAQTSEKATHFGFETVAAAEKAGRVRGVFNAVAPKYDLMNDLMSGGVHRLWKDAMADWLAPRADWSIIDVAGGTGDIAFRLLERMKSYHGSGSVTVCDINQAMLEYGRNRALDQGKLQGLEWVVGNAESLPFPDMHFDAHTIAFGLRNVTEIETTLKEARRVIKPGGRFLCLEFSTVVLPVLDKLYDTYSFSVLPRLGQMVAGDSDAYQYLAESIRRFPEQDTLVDMMGEAGFGRVSYRNLAGGIAAIHSGWRL
ncbi:MAG: bifunctional demethylmenaquinone methyltransferase/2-methoxy-6-polyprenyl-1,4-benzoquinol methylase UbiE [Rhodospirillaceae bacterium]|nr:bifunctional demethylmenaquinone methyltransferase/2-methoxy-6-polyprenyl-1,4-benzoquinol methylase UbiE [Rhodospirillaceae bacterium]